MLGKNLKKNMQLVVTAKYFLSLNRSTFRTMPNIYDGAFLVKYFAIFSYYFHKRFIIDVSLDSK